MNAVQLFPCSTGPRARVLLFACLFTALLAAGIAPVQASDPIGVYAIVQRTVLEPNEEHAERIQIWGLFALAEGSGDRYAPVRSGYLYYTLNPDNAENSRKEWLDLKKVAGSGQVVAFGGRHVPLGQVHSAEEKPANPDKYPLGMGVIIVPGQRQYGPIDELRRKSTTQHRGPQPGSTAAQDQHNVHPR